MLVAIEGVNGTGKTTLAETIAHQYRLPIRSELDGRFENMDIFREKGVADRWFFSIAEWSEVVSQDYLNEAQERTLFMLGNRELLLIHACPPYPGITKRKPVLSRYLQWIAMMEPWQPIHYDFTNPVSVTRVHERVKDFLCAS